MTQAVEIATDVAIKAPPQKEKPETEHLLTFQEYLAYEGEPDVLYELFKGQLIPMSSPSLSHTKICEFLTYKLQRYFADKNLGLVAKTTVGVRTDENTSRIPDAIVCQQSLWESISDRPGAGVLDFAEKPILVVEIVSTNRRNDYIIKRFEYEVAGIAEYWIVDPKKKRVKVYRYLDGEEGYACVDFEEDSSIVSGQFEELDLSVKELLNPPVVEDLIKDEQAKIKTLEQRAEKLAQRLRELGMNPEELD